MSTSMWKATLSNGALLIIVLRMRAMRVNESESFHFYLFHGANNVTSFTGAFWIRQNSRTTSENVERNVYCTKKCTFRVYCRDHNIRVTSKEFWPLMFILLTNYWEKNLQNQTNDAQRWMILVRIILHRKSVIVIAIRNARLRYDATKDLLI